MEVKAKHGYPCGPYRLSFCCLFFDLLCQISDSIPRLFVLLGSGYGCLRWIPHGLELNATPQVRDGVIETSAGKFSTSQVKVVLSVPVSLAFY